MRARVSLLCFALAATGFACDESAETPGEVVVPSSYAFESRFGEDSSVSYSGQVARHVLIEDLDATIHGLTDLIDRAVFMPTQEGDVVAVLDLYFRFDSDAYGAEPLKLERALPLVQADHAAISSGKDLVGKLAGNDSTTDHKDWSSEFRGWSDASIAVHGGSIDSPEGLIVAFFETIEAQAIDYANGNAIVGPNGETLPVYVTADGRDLAQLTEKFLLMAVTFSQASDDYLDDDTEGKGLLADHSGPDDDASYTALEHAWDEGFGYFGAAREYGEASDAEISETAAVDGDGDGAIDLLEEACFGASVNAAKRDLGAVAATDFSGDAFTGFTEGRAIISAADGALSEAELADLRVARDRAIGAWEAAIAATVVHYLNELIVDTNAIGTDTYDFAHHAKVWSEAKGFALGFQFNPRSPLSDQDFGQLHTLLGDAPVTDNTGAAAYRDGLVQARALLAAAYGFDAANLGDDNGAGGW